MPGPLDQIVAINISLAAPTVSQASFSIPLIVGPTTSTWADYVHTYSAPSGMLSDGFTTSSPEYIAALAMYAQSLTPAVFKVGKRSATVAQVDTLAVNTLVVGHAYSVTINGQAFSYTSTNADTQQSILTALKGLIVAALPTLGGVISGSGSSATLVLTSTVPGQVYTYTAVDADTTRTATTAANGIAQDLANIAAEDTTWYGLDLEGGSDADILQAAAWIEGSLKLFVAVSATAAIATSASTDLGSTLKAAGYRRTALVYSPANVAKGLGAAWLGLNLTQTPGSANWAFNQLAGMTADSLTAAQQTVLIGTPVAQLAGKNVNLYQTVSGVNITQMGTSASGQYLDLTVGLDWLKSTMQSNIYTLLTTQPKVPFTDAGATQVMSCVKAALDQGITNRFIDAGSPVTITAPSVASLPAAQRTARVAPPISFSCRALGALDAVNVSGTVST